MLSFDKRKGQKAQKTKAMHRAVVEQNKVKAEHSFKLESFDAFVAPSSLKQDTNMSVVADGADSSVITVHCDASQKQRPF